MGLLRRLKDLGPEGERVGALGSVDRMDGEIVGGTNSIASHGWKLFSTAGRLPVRAVMCRVRMQYYHGDDQGRSSQDSVYRYINWRQVAA
jgi:hypothetical protein